eukprot:gene37206-45160_t
MKLLVAYAKKEFTMLYVSKLCVSIVDGHSLSHPLPVVLHSIFQIFPLAIVDIDIQNMNWLCCSDVLTAQSTFFRSRVRWIYITVPNKLWKVRLDLDARPALRVFFLVLGEKIRNVSFTLGPLSGFDLEHAAFLCQHCPHLRALPFAHLETRLSLAWAHLAKLRDVVELHTCSLNHLSRRPEQSVDCVSFADVALAFPHLEAISLKASFFSLDMAAILLVLQHFPRLDTLVAGHCEWFEWRRCGESSLSIRLTEHSHSHTLEDASSLAGHGKFQAFLASLSGVLPAVSTGSISVRDVVAGEDGAAHCASFAALLSFLSTDKFCDQLRELRLLDLDAGFSVFSNEVQWEFPCVDHLALAVADTLHLSRLAASPALALAPLVKSLQLQCFELADVQDLAAVLSRLPYLEDLHISSYNDTAHFLESNFVDEQLLAALVDAHRMWNSLDFHYNSTQPDRYEIFGAQVLLFEQALHHGQLHARSVQLKQGSILEHRILQRPG